VQYYQTLENVNVIYIFFKKNIGFDALIVSGNLCAFL